MTEAAPNALFDAAAEALSDVAGLSQLEARGVLRSVLASVGLKPALLTHAKLAIVLERILPRALPGFSSERARAIGTELLECLPRMPQGATAGPDQLFQRINTAVDKASA